MGVGPRGVDGVCRIHVRFVDWGQCGGRHLASCGAFPVLDHDLSGSPFNPVRRVAGTGRRGVLGSKEALGTDGKQWGPSPSVVCHRRMSGTHQSSLSDGPVLPKGCFFAPASIDGLDSRMPPRGSGRFATMAHIHGQHRFTHQNGPPLGGVSRRMVGDAGCSRPGRIGSFPTGCASLWLRRTCWTVQHG